MNIECIKFRPMKSGSFEGYADIWVPKMGIEIYGCSVYQKNDTRWIKLPQRKFTDKDGKDDWISIMRFRDKEHTTLFCKLALAAVDLWRKDNPETVEEIPPPQEAVEKEAEDDLPF